MENRFVFLKSEVAELLDAEFLLSATLVEEYAMMIEVGREQTEKDTLPDIHLKKTAKVVTNGVQVKKEMYKSRSLRVLMAEM